MGAHLRDSQPICFIFMQVRWVGSQNICIKTTWGSIQLLHSQALSQSIQGLGFLRVVTTAKLLASLLWYAAPEGAVVSLGPSHQTELGLPGYSASPAMLPSSVVTTVVVYSVTMYLALPLSHLPEFCLLEGEMWDHRVLWLGNMLSRLKQELWVIPLHR